jgi:hypothetical protein
MLEEYYKNTFTEKAKIKTIRYLDKEKHIVLATFTSDINLMCVDNEHIGNDVTYESIYQDYKNYLISNMQATNFIIDNPKLSYIPYLVEYNYYTDYIDTLPSDLSFKQMLNTKNLDIVDVILYEGDINKNNLMNMLGSFGDNSKLYLVKQSSQNILNLSIITKEYIKSFDVIEEKYSNDGDTFFRFNQDINKIDYVDITNYGPGYDNDNIHYTNVKMLKLNNSYLKGAYNEEDKRDAYFLIRLNKQFKYDKLTLLSNSLSYRKLENDKYPETVTIPSQNGFIVIGTKEIMIANQDSEKVSWFCRIGLC